MHKTRVDYRLMPEIAGHKPKPGTDGSPEKAHQAGATPAAVGRTVASADRHGTGSHGRSGQRGSDARRKTWPHRVRRGIPGARPPLWIAAGDPRWRFAEGSTSRGRPAAVSGSVRRWEDYLFQNRGQERVKKLLSAAGGECVDCSHDERACRSSSPGFD